MQTTSFPTITDPQVAPVYSGPLSAQLCGFIQEARDEVFIRLMLRMLVVMPLAMGAVWYAVHYTAVPFWAAWLAYLALWGLLLPPVILMLHCTMHRPFFRSKFLTKAHPYVMSALFGIPSGYREHHMAVHHVEDNMGEDISSTIAYQRDSFLHFLMYFGRFFFFVTIELPLYLFRKGRTSMARRVIVMETSHELLVLGVCLLDWRFGVPAFLLPMVVVRFMMMAGNWGQHAFINVDHKNNGIANAITCINVGYNRRCFNDGYHIGHHMKANRHWTELPGDFIANREQYVREGAVVFAGIDFFLVSLLLWTKQWGILARCYVRLDGVERSDAEVIAMLKERVKPVTRWPLESIGVAAAG